MRLDEQMASALQLPVQFINGLANKASHAYKTYSIQKKSGGLRTIHHPSRELKALQRWLLANLVATWPVHDSAYAYRSSRNIRDHAAVHEGSSFLLRIDLVEFFPSITKDDLTKYLGRRPSGTVNWTEADQELFTSIVCRHDRLTIGAPSSPAISNALCWDLDIELSALAEKSGAAYTRYADDIFFSTSQPGVLASVPAAVDQILAKLSCPAMLKRNMSKTFHSSKRNRRRVTGIVLSSDGRAVVGRHRKRKVRAMIHRFEQLTLEEQEHLRGLVSYVRGFDPDFVNALVLKYGVAKVNQIL